MWKRQTRQTESWANPRKELEVRYVMEPGSGAGVQPWQDPGGTLGMNGISEKERERERERETSRGVQQSLAGSGNALFFTVTFIP